MLFGGTFFRSQERTDGSTSKHYLVHMPSQRRRIRWKRVLTTITVASEGIQKNVQALAKYLIIEGTLWFIRQHDSWGEMRGEQEGFVAVRCRDSNPVSPGLPDTYVSLNCWARSYTWGACRESKGNRSTSCACGTRPKVNVRRTKAAQTTLTSSTQTYIYFMSDFLPMMWKRTTSFVAWMNNTNPRTHEV